MAILVRRTEEQDRKENSYLMMSQRMKALEDYTRLTWERQEEIMRIRHDLRHYNRLLLSLIESGETKKAADLIIAEEGEILATSLPTYCQNPIINAALGVYFQRAEEQGIPVTHSVKLPPKLVMEERDLAILLSNVLENAIIANMRQPADRRGLNVSLQYHGPQYILSVENRCDTLLILGKDGLPVTEKKGHGLGMASLKDFCRKYGAETDFRQQDGWVRVLMYWAEEEK
jgi:sensor histidine kinase regulating citrate/malate metabolism